VLRATAAALFCAFTMSAQATAKVPSCPDTSPARTLVRGPGQLESAAFDAAGRLVFTDIRRRQLLGLDAPGAPPRTIAAGISEPGGLALTPDGDMLVGAGSGASGFLAPRFGLARLLRVDLATGAREVAARGLSMANGVVRAADGTVYASDDLAGSLDRISPGGRVQRGWFRGANTNGLALSGDGRTLYANVTFGATRVLAIDVQTATARTYARPPAAMAWAALDDLDTDAEGRLYGAAYLAGEVWRIDTDGTICALARGLRLPAGITVGAAGAGFSPRSVYVTTHTGSLIEVPGAIPAPA
jgi:sugar lactone lactonase YvrE